MIYLYHSLRIIDNKNPINFDLMEFNKDLNFKKMVFLLLPKKWRI